MKNRELDIDSILLQWDNFKYRLNEKFFIPIVIICIILFFWGFVWLFSYNIVKITNLHVVNHKTTDPVLRYSKSIDEHKNKVKVSGSYLGRLYSFNVRSYNISYTYYDGDDTYAIVWSEGFKIKDGEHFQPDRIRNVKIMIGKDFDKFFMK